MEAGGGKKVAGKASAGPFTACLPPALALQGGTSREGPGVAEPPGLPGSPAAPRQLPRKSSTAQRGLAPPFLVGKQAWEGTDTCWQPHSQPRWERRPWAHPVDVRGAGLVWGSPKLPQRPGRAPGPSSVLDRDAAVPATEAPGHLQTPAPSSLPSSPLGCSQEWLGSWRLGIRAPDLPLLRCLACFPDLGLLVCEMGTL